MRYQLSEKDTKVHIPHNIYSTDDILTLDMAMKTEGEELWVVNPPANAGGNRLLMIKRHMVINTANGPATEIFLEDTWIPVDLGLRINKKEALLSSDFRRYATGKHFVILKPGVAKKILATREAVDEMARINKRVKKGVTSDDYYASLADAGEGKFNNSDTAFGVAAKTDKNSRYETPVAQSLGEGEIPIRKSLQGLSDLSEKSQISIVSDLQSSLTMDECFYLIKNYPRVETIQSIAYTRMQAINA